MKQIEQHADRHFHTSALRLTPSIGEQRTPLITRFGNSVDVRNRGALRMSRFAGSQTQSQPAPAVVRLWTAEQCHEFSAHQARGIAAQLLAAADLADSQNK
ncbi:MAG: hypothetical protein A3I66_16230 [Burkholderiales bacterium RIFCSPLOWO2_02_FULL_57_36]|nr:MAG: hypothetical protein A3I66_16230 [Burkholderiales bacterium RIFCSPLOWO2_02_FULL_57_36]